MATDTYHKPIPIHSLIPFHVNLYDKVQHKALSGAQMTYSNKFPLLVAQGQMVITDANLLAAVAVAENFMHGFSSFLGLMGPSGDYLHHRYVDGAPKESMCSLRVAEVFCVLSNLMTHPCYQMLRTVYSVVYDRSKPAAALRDIRWIFRDTHCGISLAGHYEFFNDLTLMLCELASNASSSSSNPYSKTAEEDFLAFAFKKDELNRRTTVLNETNFSTGVAMAVNVLESASRHSRLLN